MSAPERTYDVREILALIPFQFGFWPTDSLVVVSIDQQADVAYAGRMRRTDLHGPALDDEIAALLVERMDHADGNALFVAVYTPDRGLAGAVLASLREHMPVQTAVQVAATCWVNLDEPEPAQHPLSELTSTASHARMTLLDEQYAPTRAQVMPTLADPVARQVASDAARAYSPGPNDVRVVLDHLASATPSGPEQLGTLAAAMSEEDAVAALLATVTRLPGPPSVEDVIDHLLDLEDATTPGDDARDLADLARLVAAHAPLTMRSGPLVVAAILGWWIASDTALARVHASAALSSQPQSTTPRLVLGLLDSQVAPGWVVADNIASLTGA